MTLKPILEALIFASQHPLAPGEIRAILRDAARDGEDLEAAAFAKTKEADIVRTLEELQQEYERLERAFQLVEQVNGWRLVTRPVTGRWVRQLYPESKPTRLSGPALETLAIIAYRQPIMKADIEAVRGVAVDGVVQSLLERGLIKIQGRAEIPGRPLLYATSEYFLEHFGLKSLDELPNASELRRIDLPSAPKRKETKSADGESNSEGAASGSRNHSTEAESVSPTSGLDTGPIPNPEETRNQTTKTNNVAE